MITLDFDFEYCPPAHFSFSSDWPSFKERFKHYLKNHQAHIQEQFFESLSCSPTHGAWKVDFLLPRKEYFFSEDHDQAQGHKNFEAIYQNAPLAGDYAELWSRRDFTINAMGVQWISAHDGRWCDPFAGEKDLAVGVLRKVGDHFFKDPVRFLRLIRFKRLLKMTIDQALLNHLSDFKLMGLKEKQLWDEAFKDKDSLDYIREVKIFADHFQLMTPFSTWKTFHVLSQPVSKSDGLLEHKSYRERQIRLFMSQWSDYPNEQEWNQWAQLFEMKKSVLKKIYEEKNA